jgi:hypothetical protein
MLEEIKYSAPLKPIIKPCSFRKPPCYIPPKMPQVLDIKRGGRRKEASETGHL